VAPASASTTPVKAIVSAPFARRSQGADTWAMTEAGDSATAFDAFEREGWSAGRATPYHRGLGPMTSQAIPALLDAARVRAGTRVLDVATGPGYAAAQAAARGADVVAVDSSGEMLELAARLHPGIDYRSADAGALPFGDGTFAAVIVGFLMPHVADLPAVAAELARVVRSGGRLALSTWDPEPPSFLRALLDAIAGADAVPPAHLPPGPPFFQGAGDDEFAALLQTAGLVEPSVASLSFTLRVGDFDAFWRDVVDGTVRMNAMINGQSPVVRARIRSGYEERLARWRTDAGFEVPFSVKVGSATQP
jgi:SAM-dependent methyltransferase